MLSSLMPSSRHVSSMLSCFSMLSLTLKAFHVNYLPMNLFSDGNSVTPNTARGNLVPFVRCMMNLPWLTLRIFAHVMPFILDLMEICKVLANFFASPSIASSNGTLSVNFQCPTTSSRKSILWGVMTKMEANSVLPTRTMNNMLGILTNMNRSLTTMLLNFPLLHSLTLLL